MLAQHWFPIYLKEIHLNFFPTEHPTCTWDCYGFLDIFLSSYQKIVIWLRYQTISKMVFEEKTRPKRLNQIAARWKHVYDQGCVHGWNKKNVVYQYNEEEGLNDLTKLLSDQNMFMIMS